MADNEMMFLVDYPTDETSADPTDPSHIAGDKNASSWHARIPVSVYQWLIVVGALAALWALYFGFRSDLKVG